MQSVDPNQLIQTGTDFGNIWEQNPGDSLDRTPLRVRDRVSFSPSRTIQPSASQAGSHIKEPLL